MKLQMILKDGTAIDLDEAGLSRHFVVSCPTRAAFLAVWDSMTEDNLSEVQITEDGNTTLIITGLELYGTQTMKNDDGSITGHFYFEGGEYVQNGTQTDDN